MNHTLPDSGGGFNGVIHRSPDMATVIPFPVTTVLPLETLVVDREVSEDIAWLDNNGYQNKPPGPGADVCPVCIFSFAIFFFYFFCFFLFSSLPLRFVSLPFLASLCFRALPS